MATQAVDTQEQNNKPQVTLLNVWGYYDIPLSGIGKCKDGYCYFHVHDDGGWDDYCNLPQQVKDMVLDKLVNHGINIFDMRFDNPDDKCKYYVMCQLVKDDDNVDPECLVIVNDKKYDISFQRDPTYTFYLLPTTFKTVTEITNKEIREFMNTEPKPIGIYAPSEIGYYEERRRSCFAGSRWQ